jgi:hypothetical protein
MPRRNDISKTVVLLVLSTCGIACDVFPPTVNVQPDFDIVVTDHGEPVSGIPVNVTRIGISAASAAGTQLSDAHGRVAIRGLSAGEYAVTTNGPIQVAGFIAKVVGGKAKGEITVELQWPDFRLVKLRKLEGILRSADPEHPFEDVEVKLLAVNGSNVQKVQHTGPSGRFRFEEVSPGVYVLQVRASQPGVPNGWEVRGPIAVELMPKSYAEDTVDLPLGETSCGIFYAQRDVPGPIVLATREVRVADPTGAVIGSARFIVEDESGGRVASGASDRSGVAKLPAELHGSFKLTIFRTGFTPFEINARLVTPERTAKHLEVTLDVGGACSHLKQEKHATPQ